MLEAHMKDGSVPSASDGMVAVGCDWFQTALALLWRRYPHKSAYARRSFQRAAPRRQKNCRDKWSAATSTSSAAPLQGDDDAEHLTRNRRALPVVAMARRTSDHALHERRITKHFDRGDRLWISICRHRVVHHAGRTLATRLSDLALPPRPSVGLDHPDLRWLGRLDYLEHGRNFGRRTCARHQRGRHLEFIRQGRLNLDTAVGIQTSTAKTQRRNTPLGHIGKQCLDSKSR